MHEPSGEGKPPQHFSVDGNWQDPGLSHEQLVAGFKDFIKSRQRLHPNGRELFPTNEIIRKKLDWQSGSINPKEGEFFSTLRNAWDAIAYDHYEAGATAEVLAGETLSMYYHHYRAHGEQEPKIRLTPMQSRILDALAEAADIPHQKGQIEIDIDERHRNRNKWTVSAEYQNRLARAAARARGENPNQITAEKRNSDTPNLPAEQDPFYEAFWEEVIERSSISPMGMDPAYWPTTLLFEFESLADSDHRLIKDKRRLALAEKLTPIKDSVRKMRMAYEVIAYPHVRSAYGREAIEGDLQFDSRIHHRDRIELNDEELKIVGRLCEVPRYSLYNDTRIPQPGIPFDPNQRVYQYSEVFHPARPIPKALDGAEFIAHQAREASAAEIHSKKS